jgi:CubicO group peptidase (beta-lactamase class C family)
MKNILILLTALWIACPVVSPAQPLGDDPRVVEALHLLEKWVDAERAYEEIPGLSMAVVADQELLWSGGFGYADREQSTAATPQTRYSICSVSKLFTSIGVMQLRDEGHFELNDEVETLLPWFNIQQVHPESPTITVEGLLTHSAGLPRESDYPYWTGPDFPFPERAAIISELEEQQTLYPAARYFQYSNLGLTLAGEIVAEVSGLAYADYMQEHILGPLDLTDTQPAIPAVSSDTRMAAGYTAMTRQGSRDRVPPFDARGITPAAGFSSTVEDLARFAAWQFRLLETGDEEVLDANTLREMHRVHWMDPDWDVAWGLGFAVRRSDGQTIVRHGGSCPGYRTEFAMQPARKMATVVMANANGVDVGAFASQAFSILWPALEKTQARSDSATEAESSLDLDLYTGTYNLSPWWGELEVLRWNGGLAMVSFPSDTPTEDLETLQHVDGHTFRRVRDNGELGEEVVFEVDSDGTVTGLRRHSNVYERLP